MDWLNFMPVPIALGMVLYVSHRLEQHEKNCPIQEQLKDLNNKLDIILKHLLGNRF